MTASPSPEAPPTPGEPRLTRPPSDRYTPEAPEGPVTGSTGRAVIYAEVPALIGSVLTVILGGLLAVSVGLLVVWAMAGYAIGLATQLGGGATVASRTRVAIAVVVAAIGVAVGQLGLWWYASTEGGVLAPLDYLAQTFGILVPLQAILAVALAWRTAR